MPILNKDALQREIAQSTGVPLSTVAQVLDSFQETVISTVAAGEEVKLFGFVSFEPTLRPPRVYRNPRTGEALETEEKSGVRIRPMKNFRERVAQKED